MPDQQARRLTVFAWAILLLAGVVQWWFVRHRIFSDGISYLEIATYYAQGDWHSALNEYWSPLYPLILALGLRIFHPSTYWHAALLHTVNLAAYVASLYSLELLMRELLRFRRLQLAEGGPTDRVEPALSDNTIRIAGYSTFLLAGLHLIGIGYCSPDMIAMGIGFYLAYVLLRIRTGRQHLGDMIGMGIAIGLGFLARAAFAPMTLVYLITVIILLWPARQEIVKGVLTIGLVTAAIVLPFLTALSFSKGHLTFGAAGKVNYGWEVCGAARSTHWQGEPYDIGTPVHPTHQISTHPAAYTFAKPVPGSYAPWYDPSYWYEGVKPHLKLRPQVYVLAGSLAFLGYLFIASPVTIPSLLLVLRMGLRRWLSRKGILAYWFLLLPSVLYIGLYCLVFLDRRYIAGSLITIWLSMVASIWLSPGRATKTINALFAGYCVLFSLLFVGTRLVTPVRIAISDLTHLHESEWNAQWIIAERLRELGVRPGQQVAYIGQSIDLDWARMDGLRVIAEIPVIWTRANSLSRAIQAERDEINTFWKSGPGEQARILEKFRAAGASFVFADAAPKGADHSRWQRVLPPEPEHWPGTSSQLDWNSGLIYKRLDGSPSPLESR